MIYTAETAYSSKNKEKQLNNKEIGHKSLKLTGKIRVKTMI